MTIRVFGAGVGRTGTYSLKLAINQLGLGPCHHMEAVLHDMPPGLDRAEFWGRVNGRI